MHTSHFTRRGIHWIEQRADIDAPAVVLIHGLGGDAKFWTREQAVLARQFRVLAVDLRGSGLSSGSSSPFTVEDLADDVIDVLDQAGIASAHVVGFSMGGVVAQAMALAAPARVSSLVLAATFASVNAQARLFLLALGELYRSGATATQMYHLIMPWLFSCRFLSDEQAQPYLTYVDDPSDHQTPQDWLRLLDALLGYRGESSLARIRMPTLVIGGDEDRLAPPGDSHTLVDGIEQAELAIVTGGHLMNIESPDAFMQHVECFLAARVPTMMRETAS